MKEVIELSIDLNKKHLVVIDDEKSVLSLIIKENFYNLLRKNKINYLILETNRVDGSYFIEKYNVTEFPSVLFFNNNRLVHVSRGFSYKEINDFVEV